MDGKTYIFETQAYSLIPELRISTNGRKAEPCRHLSESSFNRFVALANSGNYKLEILPNSVAWQLSRKTPKPLPKSQRCQKCGEQVLTDDIFCQQHRAQEDTLIAEWNDDWKLHDHVDHEASAAYWDEVAQQQSN